MLEYINKVKRGFRDQICLTPTGGTEYEPLFEFIAEGDYPMVIDGRKDNIKIINGYISCCNFEENNV